MVTTSVGASATSKSGPAAGTRPRASSEDAQGLPIGGRVDVSRGERRLVGESGAGADHDRLGLGPQAMGVGACGDTGDPARRPVGGGRLGVEAHRRLDQAPRPAGAAVVEIRRQRPARARRARADLDVEPRGAEPCQPAPGNSRVRVLERHHDPSHAGRDQRVRAGGRTPLESAGLERDVRGTAAGTLPRRREGVGLGVGGARTSVPPLAGDRTLLVDDDAADPGIRRRGPASVLTQRDRPGDQIAVRGLHRRTSISGSLPRPRARGRRGGHATDGEPPNTLSHPDSHRRPRLLTGSTARLAAVGSRASAGRACGYRRSGLAPKPRGLFSF